MAINSNSCINPDVKESNENERLKTIKGIARYLLQSPEKEIFCQNDLFLKKAPQPQFHLYIDMHSNSIWFLLIISYKKISTTNNDCMIFVSSFFHNIKFVIPFFIPVFFLLLLLLIFLYNCTFIISFNTNYCYYRSPRQPAAQFLFQHQLPLTFFLISKSFFLVGLSVVLDDFIYFLVGHYNKKNTRVKRKKRKIVSITLHYILEVV